MRKLNPEERRLWEFVTRSVTPLKARHHSVDGDLREAPPKPIKAKLKHTSAEPALPPAKKEAPSLKPLHVGTAVDLDAATAKKFKRGKMPVDAKLDLHGLTLAQAHGALISFIRAQAERGARCVIVITGKGSDERGEGRGKIKAELIHWLNAGSVRPYILAVNEAAPRQGGSGAVYVLLKRRDRVRTR